jgi:DNA-directed RNA polymerase subunit M/transcription elongation factor TFIIS
VSSETPIEFFCAICGQSLTAETEFAGNVISCPMCERSVPVPGRLTASDWKWQPAYTPEILSVEITFVCPGCNRALIADARAAGDPFVCPKCDAKGEVPIWSQPREDSPSATVVREAGTLSAEEIDFLSGSSPDRAVSA